MNINFYITGGNVGLQFDSVSDRDKFWDNLGQMTRNGFSAQEGAEKIKERTIRFYPAKMKEGFEWPLMSRNGQVNKAQEVNPNMPKSTVINVVSEPSKPSPKTDTITTTNPFEKLATNPNRPLPGLCPPPPATMLAQQQPAQVQDPSQAAVDLEIILDQIKTDAISGVNLIPQDDPEPLDKRTKQWKQWKARQK